MRPPATYSARQDGAQSQTPSMSESPDGTHDAVQQPVSFTEYRPAQSRAVTIDIRMIDLLRVSRGEFRIVTKTRLAPAGRRGLAILTMPVTEAVTQPI